MILSMQLSFILSLVLFCVVVQGFDQIEKKSGARQKKLKCNAKKDIKIIPLPSPVSADVAIKHITMEMALPGIMSPKQRQEKEKMKEGTVSVYDHSPQYQISQDRNALRAKKTLASAHTSSNSSKHPAEASSPSHKTNKALSSGFLSSLLSSSKIRQHEGLRDVNLHIPKSVGTSHYGKASKTRKKRQSGQPQSSECDTLSVRRPWSKATAEQRKAFLTAQMCAATIAPRKIFPNHPANSLWEDFTLLHNYMAPLVHGNPSFLVWHRLFSNAWFYAMYRHCNYQGDILYMDWWTYADRNEVWTSSDIWGDEYYGSNTGSVTDGIFSQVRVNYTTDEDDSHIFYKVNRPICREVRTVSKANIPFVSFMTSDFIREKLLTISDYDKFRDTLESTFHQYLHVSIGCDLLPMTSPNDPVFFAIHSGTDHIHALWQTRDNGANLWKYDGATSDNDATPVKMTDLLVMKDTWSRDFTVEDMLDISSRPNCYSYEWTDTLTT